MTFLNKGEEKGTYSPRAACFRGVPTGEPMDAAGEGLLSHDLGFGGIMTFSVTKRTYTGKL